MQITTQTSREISAYGGTAEATYSALRIHTGAAFRKRVEKGEGDIVNPTDVTLGSARVFRSGERKFEQGVHTPVCLLCSSRYRTLRTPSTTNCLRTASHLNWAIRNTRTVFAGIRSMKGATINGVTYEGVTEFIYLGTLISNDNSVQKDIQRRILAGSRTYFAAISLFRNRLLSRATKIRLLTLRLLMSYIYIYIYIYIWSAYF